LDDLEKHSENSESKAKAGDIRLDQLETRLHFLAGALIQRNCHIRSIELLLNEKETTLDKIYKSLGWKAFSFGTG
jgi:hypothetical protein